MYITDRHMVTPADTCSFTVCQWKYRLEFAFITVALPVSLYVAELPLIASPSSLAFLKLSLPRIKFPPPVILVSFFTSEESPSTVAFRSVYLPVRSLAFTSRPSTLVLISSILPVRFL